MLAAALLLGTASMSFGQTSASATATINATVIKGLSISMSNATLNLGTLVAGADSAVVDPKSGTVPYFTITGDGGHSVNVTYDGTVTLSGSAGGTLTFTPDFVGNNTNSQVGAGSLSSSVTLSNSSPSNGNYYCWLGGKVNPITSTQTPGTYTGTFHMSITY